MVSEHPVSGSDSSIRLDQKVGRCNTGGPWQYGRFTTSTNLQADEAFLRNAELSKANPLWLQRGNYYNIRGCRTPCNNRTSHLVNFVLSCLRFGALQRHSGADLVALDESYPLDLPSNVQLFD